MTIHIRIDNFGRTTVTKETASNHATHHVPRENGRLRDTVTNLEDRQPDTATITSTTGVRFLARILRKGDRYGLEDCLTFDEDTPVVEFYDTRYPHTRFGQFVSRYRVSTILGTDTYGTGRGGLDLMSYEPSWKIDAAAMDVIRLWLRHEVNR